MSQISLTPEDLRNVAAQYHNESGNVGELINRLNAMKENLVNIWKGSSSDAFADQYENLKPSFKKMEDLLQDVSNQLSSAANILEQTDQDIANQIRG